MQSTAVDEEETQWWVNAATQHDDDAVEQLRLPAAAAITQTAARVSVLPEQQQRPPPRRQEQLLEPPCVPLLDCKVGPLSCKKVNAVGLVAAYEKKTITVKRGAAVQLVTLVVACVTDPSLGPSGVLQISLWDDRPGHSFRPGDIVMFTNFLTKEYGPRRVRNLSSNFGSGVKVSGR
jgi:hypothetical protein